MYNARRDFYKAVQNTRGARSPRNLDPEYNVAPTNITPKTVPESEEDYYEECTLRYMKGIVLFAIGVCGLVLPPLMMYAGISHHYCEDMYSVWLIVGAVLIFIEIGVFCLKLHDNNICTKGVLNFFTVVLLIWWVFGLGRILGTAKYISRNPDTEHLGFYDDPFMKDKECKLYLFTLPFWISLLPFFFFGFGILSFFAWIISLCCDDCEKLERGEALTSFDGMDRM